MKAVLDTNVVASGLFFGGVPRAILDLVADEAFELVLSPAILDEYQRIYTRLATGTPELEARHPYLELLAYGTLVPDREVDFPITQDRNGDRHLLQRRSQRLTNRAGVALRSISAS